MSSNRSPGTSKQSLPTSVIIDIFSYVVSDYSDLARLRLINKQFNEDVFPYIISRNSSGSVKLKCGSGTHHHRGKETFFLKDICRTEEITDFPAGCKFDLSEFEVDLFSVTKDGKGNPIKERKLKIEEVLINIENDLEYWKEQEDSYISHDSKHSSFYLCLSLLEIEDARTFYGSSMTANRAGLFLPKDVHTYTESEELMEGPRLSDGYYSDGSTYLSIVSLSLPESQTDEEDGKEPKFHNGHVLDLKLVDELSEDSKIAPRKCDIGRTFRGYVHGRQVHVPMIIGIHEDMLYGGIYCIGQIQMVELCYRYGNHQKIPHGVSIVDKAIPQSLHDNLMTQINEFADKQEVDYHPHSKNVVRDIIHPALYSYVKNKSPIRKNLEKIPPCIFQTDNNDFGEEDGEGNTDTETPQDYWGRPYEKSLKYQWLPTYFEIHADGSCTICDYINNLGPRSPSTSELYTSLEKLFAHALPQLESVYSFGRAIRPHLHKSGEEIVRPEWREELPKPLVDVKNHVSFRNQKLQVITKIVDYEFMPRNFVDGELYEGVWHVEGMSHEEIVATAIYFLHRDDDINGGAIEFKRAFLKEEADYVFSNKPQWSSPEQNLIIDHGMIPLGQVQTIQNRLLVFPNSHVHKVDDLWREFKELDSDSESDSDSKSDENKEKEKDKKEKKKGKTDEVKKNTRRIVVFFLVNPEKRIISTREVKPQQKAFGGEMTHEEALKHRLELMKERKYTKQDWNVREIELCEH